MMCDRRRQWISDGIFMGTDTADMLLSYHYVRHSKSIHGQRVDTLAVSAYTADVGSVL